MEDGSRLLYRTKYGNRRGSVMKRNDLKDILFAGRNNEKGAQVRFSSIGQVDGRRSIRCSCSYAGLAFVLSIVIFALARLFSGMAYADHTDVGMMEIASGSVTGTPDAHLFFMRAPLTNIISWLYLADPEFNWYAATLYSLQILSFTLFIYYFAKLILKKKWARHFIAHFLPSLFLITFSFCSIILLQYKTTASLMMIVSLFLFADLVFQRSEGKWRSKCQKVWLLLLLWSSYMIYRSFFFLSLLFFLAVFILGFLFKRERRGFLKKTLCFLIPVIILVGTTEIIEKKNYESAEWQQFIKFDQDRSALYDPSFLPIQYKTPEGYNLLGRDKNEVYLLQQKCLFLFHNTDLQDYMELKDKANTIYDIESKSLFSLLATSRINLSKFFASLKVLPTFFLAILIWLISMIQTYSLPHTVKKGMKRRGNSAKVSPEEKTSGEISTDESMSRRHLSSKRLYVRAFLLFCLIITALLFIYYGMTNNVTLGGTYGLFGLLGMVSLLTFCFMYDDVPSLFSLAIATRKWINQMIMVMVILAACFLATSSFIEEVDQIHKSNQAYENLLDKIDEWGYSNDQILYPPASMDQLIPELSFFEKPVQTNMLDMGDWKLNSPLFRIDWKRRGLNFDSPYDLFKRKDILIFSPNITFTTALRDWLKTKGVDVNFQHLRSWTYKNYGLEIYGIDPVR